MFQTSQWFHVPAAASGSSIIRTRLFVFSGISSIVRGGFTLSPSQVYFAGMRLLLSNAGLFTINVFKSITLQELLKDIMGAAHKKLPNSQKRLLKRQANTDCVDVEGYKFNQKPLADQFFSGGKCGQFLKFLEGISRI